MEFNSKKRALSSLKTLAKKINFEPDYQREEVWSKKQQQKLIDSIFRGYYVPEILLRDLEENNEYKYEVIDGKQRLTALVKFINNDLKLPRDYEYKDFNLSNKTYEELPEEVSEIINDYNINLVFIKGTDEEIRDMFIRLQEGSPLKPQEKRQVQPGDLTNFVKELAAHPFFESVQYSGNRCTYEEEISKMILLELEKGKEKITAKKIDKLYEKYNKEKLPIETKDKVKQVLDILQNAFPDKELLIDSKILRKNTVHTLYMVVSELIDKYGYEGMENYIKDFSDFFQQFDQYRQQQINGEIENESETMNDYIKYITSETNTPKSLLGRKDIVINAWEEYVNYPPLSTIGA